MPLVLFNMKKYSIVFWEFIIFISVLVLIFIIQYGLETKNWDKLLYNTFSNILLAIASGLSVGLFFEIFVRKSQRDEILEIARISKELELAGISSYAIEFKELINDLRKYLKSSTNIDIYLSYGASLFNQISPDLLETFKKKNIEINIFILDEGNPFVNAFANLWSKIDKSYNLEGIQRKIHESSALLLRLGNTAYSDSVHANLKIFKLLNNPINFSFYRFDDVLIICPTKITERKECRALTLVCRRSNQNDIFSWVVNELDFIKDKSDSLKQIFPT